MIRPCCTDATICMHVLYINIHQGKIQLISLKYLSKKFMAIRAYPIPQKCNVSNYGIDHRGFKGMVHLLT